MRNFHITCLFIPLFLSLALKAEIDIDGVLDEPEWQQVTAGIGLARQLQNQT